jgi:hypothetical protein
MELGVSLRDMARMPKLKFECGLQAAAAGLIEVAVVVVAHITSLKSY